MDAVCKPLIRPSLNSATENASSPWCDQSTRTNKRPFPKGDSVFPSHQTLANPRFGLVSARITPSGWVEIVQFSQFLDDSQHRAERYQSRDAQRHSRRVYGVSWFSRTVPPQAAPGAAAPGRLVVICDRLPKDCSRPALTAPNAGPNDRNR